MIKIKIYGALIALIYSFFFTIVAHIDDHIPKGEMAAKSQIRSVSIQSEERVVVSLREAGVRQSTISSSDGNLMPLYSTIDIGEGLKDAQLSTCGKKFFLLKSLATEKYRVLRN